jgi:hypothetical protein
MASSMIIEEEFGSCSGRLHAHNGYYAGDFSPRETATGTAPSPSGFTELALSA